MGKGFQKDQNVRTALVVICRYVGTVAGLQKCSCLSWACELNGDLKTDGACGVFWQHVDVGKCELLAQQAT
uniref:Uncharacterized protein n=1 Tax=Daucus carota subsp. sativus TaxID=79200 RepID=A0A162A4U9_DAUCS